MSSLLIFLKLYFVYFKVRFIILAGCYTLRQVLDIGTKDTAFEVLFTSYVAATIQEFEASSNS